MGTRSLIFVMDEAFQPCACIYSQYDGYPDEHGRGWDLFNFLAGRNKVNGLGSKSQTWRNTSNGMSDMAAQLVMYLKDRKYSKLGNIYLYAPPRMRKPEESYAEYAHALCRFASDCWGEYAYFIMPSNIGSVDVKIYALSVDKERLIYSGSSDGMKHEFEYQDLSQMLNPILENA